MKGIEQHLKQDAKAFKIIPPEIVHSKIMGSINSLDAIQDAKKSRMKFWFLPFGATLVTLLLIVFNLQQSYVESAAKVYVSLNVPLIQVVNVNDFSINIESHFMNNIKQEQEAIQQDIAYMKSLFVL